MKPVPRLASNSEASYSALSSSSGDNDDDQSLVASASSKGTFIDVSSSTAVLRWTRSSPDADLHKSSMPSLFQSEADYVDNLRKHADQIWISSCPRSAQSEASHAMKRAWCRGSSVATASTSSASRTCSNTRMNSNDLIRALATIEVLPQQLEEALQEKMVAAVNDIKRSCQELCNRIHEKDGGILATQLAVERIGRIPDHIMKELSRTVAEVKDFITARMETFVLDQAQTEGPRRSPESLVHEMSQIPTQIEEIARKVLDSAFNDSTHKALAQIDRVLAPLTHDSHLTEARNQVIASMPGAHTTESASLTAEEVAKINIEDAIANVRGKPYAASDNKNVADMMMTSKVQANTMDTNPRLTSSLACACSSPSFAAPSSDLQFCSAPAAGKNWLSAGSTGHPEMCKKPCLYFQSGQCRNGSNCVFCHICHEGKTCHLDKRNRELLTKLPIGSCLQILLEALRSRAQQLPFKSAADRFVDVLESQCGNLLSCDGIRARDQKSTIRKLRCTLQGQVFSSLISLLFKVAQGLDPAMLMRMDEARSRLEGEIDAMGRGRA